MDFQNTNIKIDSFNDLGKKIDTKIVSDTYKIASNKLKGKQILMPMAKVVLVVGLLIAIVPLIPKFRLVREPLAGTKIGSLLFCDTKNLCGDARCIGETWRECKPCPTGKSRAAYKVSCDKTFYSECVLKAGPVTCSD